MCRPVYDSAATFHVTQVQIISIHHKTMNHNIQIIPFKRKYMWQCKHGDFLYLIRPIDMRYVVSGTWSYEAFHCGWELICVEILISRLPTTAEITAFLDLAPVEWQKTWRHWLVTAHSSGPTKSTSNDLVTSGRQAFGLGSSNNLNHKARFYHL